MARDGAKQKEREARSRVSAEGHWEQTGQTEHTSTAGNGCCVLSIDNLCKNIAETSERRREIQQKRIRIRIRIAKQKAEGRGAGAGAGKTSISSVERERERLYWTALTLTGVTQLAGDRHIPTQQLIISMSTPSSTS